MQRISGERRGKMKKRIVVLKNGVGKKEVFAAGCCTSSVGRMVASKA